MKIDIITLHRVRNYGSSLQTFALQKVMEDKRCVVEIIDYYQERYTSIGLIKRLRNKSERFENPIILFAARAAISFSYIKKKVVFDRFLQKYINLTHSIYRSEEGLKKNIPLADAYCTGSDQVWNSHWNEGIDAPLYLSFIDENSYKFSYASSIGNSTLNVEEQNIVKDYLKEYRHISVRENIGVPIMRNMGFDDVIQVIDPTLLFDADEWGKYTSNRYETKKYVLTYNLHHDKRIDKFANCLAKEKKLEVYNISYNWHDVVRKGKLKWCPTVEEYLGLIKDAQYVVTDSFHATIFSLIFGTKFIDIFPEEASSRLRSLLQLTGTENRGFDDTPLTSEADVYIDFSIVHEKIKEEREKANIYLDKVLSEIKSGM